MSSLVPRVALKQLKEDQVSINKSAETFVIAHLCSHRLSQFSPSHTPHTPLTHPSHTSHPLQPKVTAQPAFRLTFVKRPVQLLKNVLLGPTLRSMTPVSNHGGMVTMVTTVTMSVWLPWPGNIYPSVQISSFHTQFLKLSF